MKKKQRFSNLSIQVQFAIISIAATILAITAMFLMMRSASKMEFDNAVSHANFSLEKSVNDLQTLYTRLDVIADSFQSNDSVHELLNAGSYNDLPLTIVDSIDSETSYLKCLYTEIADIAFVNDLIHWSSLFSETDLASFYKEESMASSFFGHAIGIRKSSFLRNSSKSYYVYCSHIFDNSKSVGCIFISLDLEKLSFSSLDEGDEAAFYLMDTLGNTYTIIGAGAGYEEEVLPQCIDLLGSNIAPGKKTSFSTKNYYTSIVYSAAAQCYVISSVSLPKINEALSSSREQLIILSALLLVFVVLLLFVLYKNLINPLQQFVKIIRTMESEKQRHLTKPIEVDGCQQMTDLSRSFTSLFSTIDELNVKIFEASSKLYEEKIRGQETEISYFRSQINPHFLYNVLELIKSRALTDNAPEIAEIAVAMGKMYRYNTKGSPIVPFSEELEMTKAYIDIQKYRFKDKFDVFFNIPDEALSIPVIKILLQPLVENSIGHGIEPALEPCMLYIGATVSDDSFDIEIRDDGVGIEEKRLKEITALLNSEKYDTSTYVGIVNTNARIKLQYGNEYGISIQSSIADGTVVKIHLPAKDDNYLTQSETTE